MPNLSRPCTTKGCSAVPRACETTKVRVDSPSFPSIPPPKPFDKKRTSKFRDTGGSIVADAPKVAWDFDARANAPLASVSPSLPLVILDSLTTFGTFSPVCHSEISTLCTLFRNSKSSVFSFANWCNSSWIFDAEYDAFDNRLTLLCASVRSGNRNVVPVNSDFMSHPNPMKGLN